MSPPSLFLSLSTLYSLDCDGELVHCLDRLLNRPARHWYCWAGLGRACPQPRPRLAVALHRAQVHSGVGAAGQQRRLHVGVGWCRQQCEAVEARVVFGTQLVEGGCGLTSSTRSGRMRVRVRDRDRGRGRVPVKSLGKFDRL